MGFHTQMVPELHWNTFFLSAIEDRMTRVEKSLKNEGKTPDLMQVFKTTMLKAGNLAIDILKGWESSPVLEQRIGSIG